MQVKQLGSQAIHWVSNSLTSSTSDANYKTNPPLHSWQTSWSRHLSQLEEHGRQLPLSWR